MSAGLWAVITVATEYQIGWMAIGVGFLVGFAVRLTGKGVDTSFGLTGATLALLGCLAGNLLATCVFIAQQNNVPLLDLIFSLNLGIAVELLIETFSPIDLLFYGIAVYEGYRFAFRRITQAELVKLAQGALKTKAAKA